jgi:putative chitobiose transport system substrate-binding protein
MISSARPHATAFRRSSLTSASWKRWLVCLWAVAAVNAIAQPWQAARGAPQQITFWTMQLAPFHNAYVEGVIAAFERTNPGVKVKWVDVPWSEMERKTLAALAAGTAPDVVNLNPQFSAKLAEFGALADPLQHLPPTTAAAYLTPAWEANRLNGRAFGIPWYLTSNITLVNRSIFRQAGVAPPLTLPDLPAAARLVKAHTGHYTYFPALDGSAPLEMAVSAAGRMLTPDGCRADFSNPAGLAMFTTYRTLYAEGLVPKSILTEGHRAAVAAFLSGQVAMVSTGMQFLGQIKSGNPALYNDIDALPQLAGSQRAGPANIAAMNVAVPSSSRNVALAFRFAAFLTNAENQLALAKRVSILPSHAGSYDDAFFTTSTGDALLDKARAVSIQQVRQGAVLVPPVKGYNKLRNVFVRNLQAAIAGKKTPEAALQEIDDHWAYALTVSCRL